MAGATDGTHRYIVGYNVKDHMSLFFTHAYFRLKQQQSSREVGEGGIQ